MKRIGDYTIVSDMDGTLLGPDGRVPPRNRAAVERFVAAGGRFGIATGRSRGLMLELAQGLPINAPCVLYNGGVLYDFVRDRMLLELFLPPASRSYIETILAKMPDVGVLVISGDSYYQIQEEQAFAAFFETRAKANYQRSSLEELTASWYKVLFQVTEERYGDFLAMAEAMAFPGVRFVGTNLTLIEMLPAASNKGAALEKLMELGLVERENLVAIGDFYNDQEMIELAGIGVTLNTSPADLQARADLVVGDCAHGAVADLIEHLEATCRA